MFSFLGDVRAHCHTLSEILGSNPCHLCPRLLRLNHYYQVLYTVKKLDEFASICNVNLGGYLLSMACGDIVTL